MAKNILKNGIRLRNSVALLASLALAGAATGCFRVHVDKDANGDEKNVQVDTPFGGVHVNTNQLQAADLGLPAYPGAKPLVDDDRHKSADVHLGFGEWEFRVRAVNYGTPDAEDKVTAFYKKALARYGDVLVCQSNHPVTGSPTTTAEGLTCSDDSDNGKVKIDRKDFGGSDHSTELKAGSKRHQHIVGFEDPKDGQTHFALVVLDLPAGVGGDSKSD